MGIYIHESISKEVTKEEWKQVYEETLVLMAALPFAEKGSITYAGKKVPCIVPTKEREAISFQGDRTVGWNTSLDYNTIDGAEAFFIPRDLVDEGEREDRPWDAMMEALPVYVDFDWGDEMFGHTYSLWDAATEGQAYHKYILAVACLIEDRLGEKAFIYGNISKGQCQEAVELANQYLKAPIRVPARCEMERLFERVRKLPIEDAEKVEVFEKIYLGALDKGFIDFEQAHFSKESILGRWRKQFSEDTIGTTAFSLDLKKYLALGLGLEELCGIVEMEGPDGKPQYEAFLKAVMDSKLHLQEKNTTDYLDTQPGDRQPHAPGFALTEFLFREARNIKVDRYIPIGEIRASLKKGIGGAWDVDAYISQYLEREAAAPKIDIINRDVSQEELEAFIKADAVEVLTQMVDKKLQEAQAEGQERYDISDYRQLLSYQEGNSVKPRIMEALGKSFQYYHGAVQEEEYRSLMAKSPEERCLFLVGQNKHLALRDCDWLRIFSEIEGNPESFERYYPMVRMAMDTEEVRKVARALVLNDAFYAYVKELSKKYE